MSGSAARPVSRSWVSVNNVAAARSSARSAGRVVFMLTWPSKASLTCDAPHWSSCTRLDRAWSAVASPDGRYGAARNTVRSFSLAACMDSGSVITPSAAALRRLASSAARSAIAARSRSPGGRGDSSSTAIVPAAEASHQPASWLGIIDASPAETTGST